MVARIRPRTMSRTRRPGAGRKRGGEQEVTRVARARAERSGKMPKELLLEWARTGEMDGQKLTVKDRMYAATSAARYYDAPVQPRPAEGEKPPVYHVDLSTKTLQALSRGEKEALRDVLVALGAGDVAGAMAAVGVRGTATGGDADPSRYAATLRPDSTTAGSA